MGIGKLYRKLKLMIFSNPTRELLKSYLFWVEFVAGITTTDEFKKRLKKIKSLTLYKNKSNQFFLTLKEAHAQNEEVEPIRIKEILSSNIYPLILLERLERITLYAPEDLQNVTRNSQMVWMKIGDIMFHLILKKQSIVYPKDYPVNNIYRFGYSVLHDENGFMGLYDIDNDTLVLPFEYKYINALANIVELSKEDTTFEIINVETNEKLQTNEEKTFPHISQAFKEKINLSKIELEDYMQLLDTPSTQTDLEAIGLWGAKVGVMEVPSGYEEIIEDSSTGTIGYSYPVSADIFDMRVELPVEFKKTNGEYVTLGIEHKYLILQKEYREKLSHLENLFSQEKKPKEKTNTIQSFKDLLKRGNLPDDNRVVPTWLKIKNEQFEDVDFSNNSVDEIVKLTSEEFNEFVSTVSKDILFVYLSTLSQKELEKFYQYNDDVVKLAPEAKETSREQFEKNLKTVKESWEIENIAKQRATLEIPLAVNYAKNSCKKIAEFEQFIQAKYYAYQKDDIAIRYEGTLTRTLYHDEMKFTSDYFEQVMTHFKDFYDANNEEHRLIAQHIAKRFGLLMSSLECILRSMNEKHSSLEWFLKTFANEIKKVDGYDILKSDELTFHMMNMYASIIHENDESYLSSLICVVNRLFDWYLINKDACHYALVEMIKSVAMKNVSVENANSFVAFFEELPRFYEQLSYENIHELKMLINHALTNYKPLDNVIFEDKAVKNKLIVLNYFVDMEDLYYESGKNE